MINRGCVALSPSVALLCLGLLSCEQRGLLLTPSGAVEPSLEQGIAPDARADAARVSPPDEDETRDAAPDGFVGLVDAFTPTPPDAATPARDVSVIIIVDLGPPEQDAFEPPRPLAPCDFDGDGFSDLGLFDPPEGMWHVISSRAGQEDASNWGWRATDPVPAEYDGDGQIDKAVYHPPTGDWYILSGVDGWVSDEPVTVGPPNAFPAPADYDGDGLDELAVYDPLSTTWHERDLGDRGAASRQTQFGLPFAVPIPADFDGDGVDDRAVYQKRLQRWLIQKSSDGQTLDFEFGAQYGRVVAGDYDGDGQADAASFNRKTGAWAIRSTATGQPPPWAPVMFDAGVGGLPVHLDLDGDQIADPAVVLAEQGSLLARLSSSGEIEARALPQVNGRFICSAPLDYRGGKHVGFIREASIIRNDPDSRALAITLDRLEQPHVMTDRNDNPGLNLYSRIGGGWRAIEPVIQKEDHGPMYPTPHIDADDRLWFSSGVFRAGDMDVTSAWIGMMSDVTTAPTLRWTHKIRDWWTFGGRLAIDPHSPGQAWHLKTGAPTYEFRKFDVNGYVGRDGEIDLSQDSRTMDFQIAEVAGGRLPGIRHIAHAVSYQGSGKNLRPSYRNDRMGAHVIWNQTLRSDGIDSDSTNAALGLDETDPHVAFMSAFTDSLKMNIWNGAGLVYGDAPHVVDSAPASLGNAVPYFSPQWSHAANGGAFLCWTDSQHQIRLQHFDVEGHATPEVGVVVGPGKQCDLTTDFRGDLHLTYINGALRYQVVHTRAY